jgi:hypothetical protein
MRNYILLLQLHLARLDSSNNHVYDAFLNNIYTGMIIDASKR